MDGLPAECPPGEIWQHGELGPCEKTCPEMNMTQAWSNCTEAQVPGCVCQLGHFRSQTGLCVPEDHCECWHHGSPHLVRQQPAPFLVQGLLIYQLVAVPLLSPYSRPCGSRQALPSQDPAGPRLKSPLAPSQAPVLGHCSG